ncbi:gliding motility lipoprotein GldB [Flavobacteriaceae bacterium F08102]|nr:gliding motility lipoprotein GldB [Flavobacteriaceae bacterium F08102]
MYRYISLILLLFTLINCTNEDKLLVDVSGIEVHPTFHRFDKLFYEAKPRDLPKLKEAYPYLFPEQNPDSVWINKMQDVDEQELFKASKQVFPTFKEEEEALIDLFKHVKYYFPAFEAPDVISLISNVDYETKVIYADSLMLVSLDLYLGPDSEVYRDFPNYIKQNFRKDRLVIDAAEAITRVQIPFSMDRTFLSRMIQEGKQLYLYDAYMPAVDDATKIGYTEDQIAWAEANQTEVWKYFIQKELLYSTDFELSRRFIDPAPFSKFYLENDNETPGSIGRWFGWQMVRAFMKNTNTSIPELLKTPNETIFKKSKYKPAK